jgi:hypothetical protein
VAVVVTVVAVPMVLRVRRHNCANKHSQRKDREQGFLHGRISRG